MSDSEGDRQQQGRRRGRPPLNSVPNRLAYNTRRNEEGRSRSRSRNRQQHALEDSQNRNEDNDSSVEDQSGNEDVIPDSNAPNSAYISCLRTAFIEFFHKVKHNKGFVFTLQERQRMMKQQLKKQKKDSSYIPILWKLQSDWQEQSQNIKIKQVLEQLLIQLSEEGKDNLRIIMLGISYLFADEVTEELYKLITSIASIVINSEQNQQEQQVKDLMKEVESKNGQYKFFSFSFSSYFLVNLKQEEKKKAYQELGFFVMKVLQQKF